LVIKLNLCHLYVDRVTGGVWPHDTFARQKVVGVHSWQASKVCFIFGSFEFSFLSCFLFIGLSWFFCLIYLQEGYLRGVLWACGSWRGAFSFPFLHKYKFNEKCYLSSWHDVDWFWCSFLITMTLLHTQWTFRRSGKNLMGELMQHWSNLRFVFTTWNSIVTLVLFSLESQHFLADNFIWHEVAFRC